MTFPPVSQIALNLQRANGALEDVIHVLVEAPGDHDERGLPVLIAVISDQAAAISELLATKVVSES